MADSQSPDAGAQVALYMAPGTCARVPAIGLFEAGALFEPRLVRFMAGEHRSPQFLAVSPLGKVPALCIDGAVLTENVAIVRYLARRFPDARLMPKVSNDMEDARQVSDLCYCAATLHPIVTRIRIPPLFAETQEAQASVYRTASASMAQSLARAERRLGEATWWYGADWSLMDAYLGWVWFRITGAGFDPDPFPALSAHHLRLAERPATQRALALEAELEAQLQSQGLGFSPPEPPVSRP